MFNSERTKAFAKHDRRLWLSHFCLMLAFYALTFGAYYLTTNAEVIALVGIHVTLFVLCLIQAVVILITLIAFLFLAGDLRHEIGYANHYGQAVRLSEYIRSVIIFILFAGLTVAMLVFTSNFAETVKAL